MGNQTIARPPAVMPPMKPSKESSNEQFRLAQEQGEVYNKALQAMDK